jgi:hypothetical protein
MLTFVVGWIMLLFFTGVETAGLRMEVTNIHLLAISAMLILTGIALVIAGTVTASVDRVNRGLSDLKPAGNDDVVAALKLVAFSHPIHGDIWQKRAGVMMLEHALETRKSLSRDDEARLRRWRIELKDEAPKEVQSSND